MGGKFRILRPFQGVGGAGRITVTDDSKVLSGLGEGFCCPESWLRREADSHVDLLGLRLVSASAQL